jgi:pyridoxine 4-dehydrogenase
MQVMRKMQQEGLLDHIGVSTVNAAQLRIARGIAPVVCVQNHYNLVHRDDDAVIDALAQDGIAYVPYFPLGGFTPLQTEELRRVADEMGQAAQSVALAWLLNRSPNILLIPGTSRRAHLRQNVAAAALRLSEEQRRRLDPIASAR